MYPVDDLQTRGYVVGGGAISRNGDRVRLSIGANDGSGYVNAQLDDYHTDGTMKWHAPVVMRLRARLSHGTAELGGTAGFGFWNDPFGMTGQRLLGMPRFRLPQATWFFFASPPSDMPLALDIPGHGLKMATIDAGTALAALLLPLAPLGMALCRVPVGYRSLWPLAQRILKVDEKRLALDVREWHEYEVVWKRDSVTFDVDGEELFRTRFAPRGPLGVVVWIDNQFMVATPQGTFHHGMLPVSEQWMELEDFAISRHKD